MTVKRFLKYFNLMGTDIKSVEIIQNFNVILFFTPNNLKHGKMDIFLEKCLLSSFSIKKNVLKIYIK